MNRVQLVQVIVIIMAIMLGYQMIISFANFAGSVVSFFDGSGYSTDVDISFGIYFMMYAISLLIIINSVPKITTFIIEKVQPDENMQIGLSDSGVLYGILLFLTLGTLLKNIPVILYDLFKLFSGMAGGTIRQDYRYYVPGFNWPCLIEAIIALILLVNIKVVVNYFRQKIDPHYVSDGVEPVIENE